MKRMNSGPSHGMKYLFLFLSIALPAILAVASIAVGAGILQTDSTNGEGARLLWSDASLWSFSEQQTSSGISAVVAAGFDVPAVSENQSGATFRDQALSTTTEEHPPAFASQAFLYSIYWQRSVEQAPSEDQGLDRDGDDTIGFGDLFEFMRRLK